MAEAMLTDTTTQISYAAIVAWMRERPGARVLLLFRESRHVQVLGIPLVRGALPPNGEATPGPDGWRFRSMPPRITLANGARIDLDHADSPVDVERYRGRVYDRLVVASEAAPPWAVTQQIEQYVLRPSSLVTHG